jgi:hypothetical protein
MIWLIVVELVVLVPLCIYVHIQRKRDKEKMRKERL